MVLDFNFNQKKQFLKLISNFPRGKRIKSNSHEKREKIQNLGRKLWKKKERERKIINNKNNKNLKKKEELGTLSNMVADDLAKQSARRIDELLLLLGAKILVSPSAAMQFCKVEKYL